MRPRRLRFAPILVWGLIAGCGSVPQSPISPSSGGANPIPTPTPIPAPTAPSSPVTLASVSIDDAYAIRGPECTTQGCPSGRHYFYDVRFLVRESGGKSGARIYTVFVNNPHPGPGESASDTFGDGCWRDPIRVPPGGTLDTFYSDKGVKSLSYCGVFVVAAPELSSLELEVHFVDDEGKGGAALATISQFR